MSVLIKGMKMPECCVGCDLSVEAFDGNYTHLACRRLGEWCVGEDECRLDNCPLVEEPKPHGRLINLDAALSKLVKKLGIKSLDYLTPSEKVIVDIFTNELTVIEAEE